MAQCETCTAGLGIVTEIILDGYPSTGVVGPLVRSIECPDCKGVGHFCNICLKPADCDCYEPPPSPRKRPYQDNW